MAWLSGLEKMQEMQEGHMKDAPEGTSVRWFQINEKTHGSVLTFSSKEVYDSIKAEVDEHRSTQTDCKLITVYEGVVKVESNASGWNSDPDQRTIFGHSLGVLIETVASYLI